MQEIFDVTIIGAGVAGLFAANYAGMRGMKTKVIEYLPDVGGSVAVFYPEKNIYDVGGVPCISGHDLVEQLREQALMHGPTMVLGQMVENLDRLQDGGYCLTTTNGVKHYTKTVIITAGIGVYKIRHLKLDSGILEEGSHVFYEPNDLSPFAGKRVLVYGGLSAAVNRSIELSKIADQVIHVHHSTRFSAYDQEVEELRHSQVTVKSPYRIQAVHEGLGKFKEVVLKHAESGEEELIAVSDLIISHGYNFDQGAISKWGFTLDNRRIIVDNDMSTSFEGIFVAGDIAGYKNKWRLISSAFNEAITAVNGAKKYIDPSAPAQVYSSILMDKSIK